MLASLSPPPSGYFFGLLTTSSPGKWLNHTLIYIEDKADVHVSNKEKEREGRKNKWQGKREGKKIYRDKEMDIDTDIDISIKGFIFPFPPLSNSGWDPGKV